MESETILLSLLGVASSTCMMLLYRSAKRDIDRLHDMEHARVFSTHKLANSLEDPNFLAAASVNPLNPDEHIIKAFVEGKVRCENPIKGTIPGNDSELVYRIYHRADIYSNQLLNSKSVNPKHLKYGSLTTQVRAPLVFDLEDEETKESCTVHRAFDVDASDALVKVGENREIRPLSWSDKFLIFLGVVVEGVRQVLAKNSETKFRGLKIGFTEREFGIRVNSVLTVFGDVVYNSKDKSIRIDSPLYYLQSKARGLKLARTKFSLSLTFAVITGIIAFGCGLVLFDRATKYYEALQKKKLEKKEDKISRIKTITLENGYKCMMCQTQPRNVILKPCLHFSLCKACLALKKDKCPVCHESVEESVDIFFS